MNPWDTRSRLCEGRVLGRMLRRRAHEQGAAVHARFQDGSEWTFADAFHAGLGVAAGLRELGVGKGEPVLTWLPNGADALRAWYGVNLAGAIYAPLNTAYRGALLEHAINLTGATVLLAHPELVAHLDGLHTPELTTVIALRPGDWPSTADERAIVETDPWDPYAIIFTSGTTGPSKGVTCSYVQLATSSLAAFEDDFGPGDRYMVNLPLFHAGGTIGVYASLLLGGSLSVVERFDTRAFWDDIRASGTTHVTLLGAMANFLAAAEPSPRDRDHPLKRVIMLPLIERLEEFGERFGVHTVSMYNMTEISVPIISPPDPTNTASCGRLRPGVEARLVDEHDREVPGGSPGELILRTQQPWALNSGYWNMPEATAEAWRNGWFHTGDVFRVDAQGDYYFVDRRKDAIRRRGENISSFEVEREVLAHPAVREAAAVGVPSPQGEDDLLVAISLKASTTLAPEDLFAFLTSRAAHYMVPRYIRVLPELPKTPTNKIEKHRLRTEGVTHDTWDRTHHGLEAKHTRLT
ncbi:AMP-binding protein [Spirillospora sp. CA-255316]